MRIYYVYQITNLINNKIYIGQTINPKNRWSQHKNRSKQENKNIEMIINHAMKKYGIENFTFDIIASCLNQDAVNEVEEICIKQHESHISTGKGYNVSLGGCTAPKSEEWKQMMRECWQNEGYRQIHITAIKKAWQNEEYRQNQIKQSKENWQDPEYRKNMEKVSKKRWSDPKQRKAQSKMMLVRMSDPIALADRKEKWTGKGNPRFGTTTAVHFGEKSPNSKLKEKDILEIRELSKTMTYTAIAKKYSVSRKNIAKIINRETWKHIK